MLSTLIIAVILAVVISALCSVMEAALYATPTSHIEAQARSGSMSGLLLKQLRKDIEQPIIAILTLNTIANTIGAAVAGASAVAIFGNHSLPLFSIIFTLVILLFSEILPKTIGVAYSKKISAMIALPLLILVRLMIPIIWLCKLVTRFVPGRNQFPTVSIEEIQAVAALSRKTGAIEPHQEKVISNILDLENKTVRQVMTPRPVTFILQGDLTVNEALEHKDKWDLHSRVPVYDQDVDDVVGVVLRKDVLNCAAKNQPDTTLESLMHPVHFVPESAPLDTIFLEFVQHRQHLFVVVDEYGGFTGIVTLEDIIEEIVGQEIIDETDKTSDMRELARLRRKTLANTFHGP